MDSSSKSDSIGGNSWKEEASGELINDVTSTGAFPAALDHNLATDVVDSAPSPEPSLPVAISDTPSTSQHRKGVLDHATEFINDHIRAFRQLPWVIGGVGVVLLIRFYPRLAFRRYQRPSDIPRQLVENNVKLTGIVAMTGWNSLGVWHVPLWRRVFGLRYQPIDRYSDEDLLSVKFAGVAIGNPENCEKWLEDTILGKRVWFTLLDHTSDGKSLSCVVYAKHTGRLKFGRKWCVNEQLLAKGFGSLDEVTGFTNQKNYTNFIHRLGRKEMNAKRTGAGVWEGSEYVSWWRRIAKTLRLIS